MQQINSKPIFVVDAMLGNIAKKLRLLGFDSEYSSNSDDVALIIKSKNENRILITKDVPLYERAKKQKTSVICLTNDKEVEQLSQIFKNLKLSSVSISGNSTRCTDCNQKLESVEKQNVKNRIPEGVFEKLDNFWQCSNCNKIYWEGTHIQRLQKFVDELNEKL